MIIRILVLLLVACLGTSCGTVYENYTAMADDKFVVADLLFDESASQRLCQEMQIKIESGYCAEQTHLVTKFTLWGPYDRYNIAAGGYEIYIPFTSNVASYEGLGFVRKFSYDVVLADSYPHRGGVLGLTGRREIRFFFDELSEVPTGTLIVTMRDGGAKIEIPFRLLYRKDYTPARPKRWRGGPVQADHSQ